MEDGFPQCLESVRIVKRCQSVKTDFGDEPRYGQLWRHPASGRLAVILGNSIHNGLIWVADNDTGEMTRIAVKDLVPATDLPAQPLSVTVAKCEGWARNGDPDAMWWLGHVYEFGGTDLDSNGRKALAYYMAAIRRDPDGFGDNFERVYADGQTLFELDVTPQLLQEASEFCARFIEFTPAAVTGKGVRLGAWREAIDIAEEEDQPEDQEMGVAVCIGCGCHDYRACYDEKAGEPCHWLEVDYEAGRGVCSACEDHLERWKAGDREISVPNSSRTTPPESHETAVGEGLEKMKHLDTRNPEQTLDRQRSATEQRKARHEQICQGLLAPFPSPASPCALQEQPGESRFHLDLLESQPVPSHTCEKDGEDQPHGNGEVQT